MLSLVYLEKKIPDPLVHGVSFSQLEITGTSTADQDQNKKIFDDPPLEQEQGIL
jgi:hypothetical protein